MNAVSVETTVFRATWAVSILAVAVVWLRWGAFPALAVVLGAGLSLLNLYWLRDGAHAIVYRAAAAHAEAAARLGSPPRLGRLCFIARFAVLLGALYAIFMSHLVPFPPVLGGLLAAPAGLMAGVTIEARRGWSRNRRAVH